MVTGWVSDAPHTPPLFFVDRCDLSCSGRDRLGEYDIRGINGQDHSDGRSAAQGFRARVPILLHPKHRLTNRELSHHHAARFVFEAFHLDCAERRLVEVDCVRRIGNG